MSRRALLLFVALMFVAVGVAAAMVVSAQRSAVAPVTGGYAMFPALTERADELRRITVETQRYRIVIEETGGRWVATSEAGYPVRDRVVADLVAGLAGLTAFEPKTANPSYYSYIGVAQTAPGAAAAAGAGTRVTASTADGEVLADVILGRLSTSIPNRRRGGMFVRSVDAEQAWLVEGTVAAPGFLQDWFEAIINIPSTEVGRLTILAGSSMVYDAVKVNFTTGDYELAFLAPEAGPAGATADDDGIRSITQAIVTTTFDRARPLETVTFGPEARTLRFLMASGLQLDVRLGEADGATWVAYSASATQPEAAAAAAAINERTSRWAFRLPAGRIIAFSRPITDLFVPPAVPNPLAPQPPRPGMPVPLP